MTPEEVIATQLDLHRLQLLIMGGAILLGPVTGVLIGNYLQRKREKLSAKSALFLLLMGTRRTLERTDQIVQALNTIEVVFADTPSVLQAWRQYYDSLQGSLPTQKTQHSWIELLSTMATSLGYQRLSQVEIDKYYLPNAHGTAFQRRQAIQEELLRVLQNTGRVVVSRRGTPPSDPEETA